MNYYPNRLNDFFLFKFILFIRNSFTKKEKNDKSENIPNI